MFDELTKKLSLILRNISGRGRLTENNIKDVLREVRVALLEADVSLQVISEFIQKIKKNAIGQNINKSLTPGQKFIKIVRDELTKTLGEKNNQLNLSTKPPAIILITGLPGTGKTTTIIKLGKILKEKQKKKILIVSIDIYRPAAIKQLEILAKNIEINIFSSNKQEKPIDIIQKAIKYAQIQFYDVLLVDTAGCLHTNKPIMEEIKKIHNIIKPIETLLVIDAMTGQDSANIAKTFNEVFTLTGIILTKIDSDARGGAALSIRAITNKPIKFLGTGEKIDDLEPFYPDRIASRILGMGDFISLIEEIENKTFNIENKKLTKKINNGANFNLNDFLIQLKQMQNLGGINNIINKIPKIQQLSNTTVSQLNDKSITSMKAIINSMTHKEREQPEIINGSRKRRIATGSGTTVQEVNNLLKQFNILQRMIKKIKKTGLNKMIFNIKKIMRPGF
ncbi:Signal recognition particle protein [Candidatus Providencia siddallii]|uniref:Signal recognition particle protein n=1 Tax=Candidatus Providencia siddallii TaxID=1715285 RepID=A0A0M6W770_9GAMM|nr:Signal recognition particle protein [Candidatus Providencia siddallii]